MAENKKCNMICSLKLLRKLKEHFNETLRK